MQLRFNLNTDRIRRKKSGYPSASKVYCCWDWNENGQKTKTFFFAEKFNEYRRKSLENICSEEGIEERINRSIQTEGVFSKLESGLNYHRFPCKGLQNIKAEIDLLALVLNVNTLVAKIQRADFKPTRYIIKQAS